MKKFELIDITTADVAFVAYGKELNELFENAALAMFEIMTDTKKVAKNENITMTLEGIDLKSLMFNWLNELLVYVDSDHILFSGFNVKIDQKNMNLKAVCKGERTGDKHEIRCEIKAATYHRMQIEHEKDFWRCQVILDI